MRPDQRQRFERRPNNRLAKRPYSIRLEVDDIRRLEAIAKSRGKKPTQLAREAIEQLISE